MTKIKILNNFIERSVPDPYGFKKQALGLSDNIPDSFPKQSLCQNSSICNHMKTYTTGHLAHPIHTMVYCSGS
jgi:hypothetical protein